jgi:acyl carrier protein
MRAETHKIVESRHALVTKVKDMLISRLNLDLYSDEMAEDGSLFGFGLGLDSIDALTLVVGIEDTFKVRIPDNSPHILRSVNTIADFIVGTTEGDAQHV